MQNPGKKNANGKKTDAGEKPQKKEYRPYTVTTADAYIFDIRNSGDYYFADVSMRFGKDKDGDKIYQNVSLLVSKRLEYLMEKIEKGNVSIKGISWSIEVHNLFFYVNPEKDEDGDNYIGNQGILNSIKL